MARNFWSVQLFLRLWFQSSPQNKDLNDLNKVWEIKPRKKIGEDEARLILERVAKQVQPIMRKRKWKVNILSEFWYSLFSHPSIVFFIPVRFTCDLCRIRFLNMCVCFVKVQSKSILKLHVSFSLTWVSVKSKLTGVLD